MLYWSKKQQASSLQKLHHVLFGRWRSQNSNQTRLLEPLLGTKSFLPSAKRYKTLLTILESGAPTTITSTDIALTTFTENEERGTCPMLKQQLCNRVKNGGEIEEYGTWFVVLRSHNIWERLREEDPDRQVTHTNNVQHAINFQRWPRAGVECPSSTTDDEYTQRILRRTISIHHDG